MRIALVIAGLLVSLVAQPQDIYRWVDKDGIVHYADQPGAPDATRVEQEQRGLLGNADAPPLYQQEQPQFPERPAYRSLSIATPAPDQVFFGGDVHVPITAVLDGRLRDGDELVVLVDGNRVPGVSGMGATASGLSRGTHFLRAIIVDPAGELVIASPQITFHLRQATIATPNTGPTIKTPSRPTSPGS